MARVSGGRWAYLAEIEKQKAEPARHRDQFDMSRGGLKALGGTILDLGKTLGVEYAKWKMGGEEKAGVDLAKARRMDAGTKILTHMDAGPTGLGGNFLTAVDDLGERRSFKIGDIEAGHKGPTSVSSSRPAKDESAKFFKLAAQYDREAKSIAVKIEKLSGEDRKNNTNKNAAKIASLRIAEKKAIDNKNNMLLRGGVLVDTTSPDLDIPPTERADKLFSEIAEQYGLSGKDLGASERVDAIQGAVATNEFTRMLEDWQTNTGNGPGKASQIRAQILSASDPRESLKIIERMGPSFNVRFETLLRTQVGKLAEGKRRHVPTVAPTVGQATPAAPAPTMGEFKEKARDAWQTFTRSANK